MKRKPQFFKRKAIDTAKDPYLTAADPKDPSSCRKCGSVYHGKRWVYKDAVPAEMLEKAKPDTLCPACMKIRDNYAEGFLVLEGDFVKEHREEILNLIKNKETLALSINPLERIISLKEKKGVIEISTTTDKLAQRIGQILSKAFHSEAEFKWSSDTKLARVIWKRDG